MLAVTIKGVAVNTDDQERNVLMPHIVPFWQIRLKKEWKSPPYPHIYFLADQKALTHSPGD